MIISEHHAVFTLGSNIIQVSQLKHCISQVTQVLRLRHESKYKEATEEQKCIAFSASHQTLPKQAPDTLHRIDSVIIVMRLPAIGAEAGANVGTDATVVLIAHDTCSTAYANSGSLLHSNLSGSKYAAYPRISSPGKSQARFVCGQKSYMFSDSGLECDNLHAQLAWCANKVRRIDKSR